MKENMVELDDLAHIKTGVWMVVPNDCGLKGRTLEALYRGGVYSPWAKGTTNSLDVLNGLVAWTGGPQVFEVVRLTRTVCDHAAKPLVAEARMFRVPFVEMRRSLAATKRRCRYLADMSADTLAYAVDTWDYAAEKGRVETAMTDTLRRLVPPSRRLHAARFGATEEQRYLEDLLRDVFDVGRFGLEKSHRKVRYSKGDGEMSVAQWAGVLNAGVLTGGYNPLPLTLSWKAMQYFWRNGVKFVKPDRKVRDAVVRQALAEVEFHYADRLAERSLQAKQVMAKLETAAKELARLAKDAEKSAWKLAERNNKEVENVEDLGL